MIYLYVYSTFTVKIKNSEIQNFQIQVLNEAYKGVYSGTVMRLNAQYIFLYFTQSFSRIFCK